MARSHSDFERVATANHQKAGGTQVCTNHAYRSYKYATNTHGQEL